MKNAARGGGEKGMRSTNALAGLVKYLQIAVLQAQDIAVAYGKLIIFAGNDRLAGFINAAVLAVLLYACKAIVEESGAFIFS